MARYSIDDAAYWHDRAAEARAVATQIRDADAKHAMLRIAENYDELAMNAMRRAAVDKHT